MRGKSAALDAGRDTRGVALLRAKGEILSVCKRLIRRAGREVETISLFVSSIAGLGGLTHAALVFEIGGRVRDGWQSSRRVAEFETGGRVRAAKRSFTGRVTFVAGVLGVRFYQRKQ